MGCLSFVLGPYNDPSFKHDDLPPSLAFPSGQPVMTKKHGKSEEEKFLDKA